VEDYVCGIAGFSGISDSEELAFELAVRILPRGRHAHGWVTIDGSGDVTIGRRSGPWEAESVMAMRGTKDAFMHSRHATCGDPGDWREAHPFSVGGIIGVHNGMVFDWDQSQYRVDSEHALARLASGEGSLGDGYGAFAWTEPGSGYACILRASDEGEMVACSLRGGGMVYGSTHEIVEGAVQAARQAVAKWYRIDVGVVYEIACGMIYATSRKARFMQRTRQTKWEDAYEFSSFFE
jgi:hypothetical protein